MPIRFKCPECEAILNVSTALAGGRIECSACRKSILVPSPKAGAAGPLADLVAAIEDTDKDEKKDEEDGKDKDRKEDKKEAKPDKKTRPAAKERKKEPRQAEVIGTKAAGEQKKPKAPEPSRQSEARRAEESERTSELAAQLAELTASSAPPAEEAPAKETVRPKTRFGGRPRRPDDPAALEGARAKAPPAKPVRKPEARAMGEKRPPPRPKKGLGAATLLLLAAAVGLVFLPWAKVLVYRTPAATEAVKVGEAVHTYKGMDLVVVSISPASFVVNRSKIADAVSPSSSEGRDDSAEGEGSGPAGLMLGAAPFAYGVGLIVAVVGAFQILSQWRSIPATVGFGIAFAGCLLAVIGLLLFSPETPGREITGGHGVVLLVLTPWLYAAFLVTLLGFAASLSAMSGGRSAKSGGKG